MKLHKNWKLLFVLVVLAMVVIFGVFMTITVPEVKIGEEILPYEQAQ